MKRPDLFLKKLMKHVLGHRLVPEGFRLEYELDPSRLNESEDCTDHHLIVTNGETWARVQIAKDNVCVFIEQENTDENSVLDEIRPNCVWTDDEKRATHLFVRCLDILPDIHHQIKMLIKSREYVREWFEDLFCSSKDD
jgi:hypothetical protein